MVKELPPFLLKKKEIKGTKGEKTSIFPKPKEGKWESEDDISKREEIDKKDYEKETLPEVKEPIKPGPTTSGGSESGSMDENV